MKSNRVIVATSQRALGRLITLALAGRGLETIHCLSVTAVLRRALTDRPFAIVMDPGLPGGDAGEVVGQLEAFAATRRLPVLFLPPANTLQGLSIELRPGLDRILPTPLTPQSLRHHLERLLGEVVTELA